MIFYFIINAGKGFFLLRLGQEALQLGGFLYINYVYMI
nr:MAG TPA: hypothetical protein [Caudoviricetes sp.]